jgi:hypothetical protein
MKPNINSVEVHSLTGIQWMVWWWVLVHCGLVLGLYPTHVPRLHHLWSVIVCGEFLHRMPQMFFEMLYYKDGWFIIIIIILSLKKNHEKCWFLKKCCHFFTPCKSFLPLCFWLEKTLDNFLKSVV